MSVHVHEFVGRLDRWCEVCNLPDRHPIHDTLRVISQRDRIRREQAQASEVTARKGS